MPSFLINVIYYAKTDKITHEKIPVIYRKIAINKLALIPKLIETVLDVYELDFESMTDYMIWAEHDKTKKKIWSIDYDGVKNTPSFKRKNLNITILADIKHDFYVVIKHSVLYSFSIHFEGETKENAVTPLLVEKKGEIFY